MSFSLNKWGVPSPTGGSKVMEQPKPKCKFRVLTYGFGADTTWGDNGGYVCFATESVSRPKLTVDTHELHTFDGVSRMSGKCKWGDITLSIRDTVSNDVATAVHSQIQKQRDFYRRMAPRAKGYSYKFEMMIQTMTGQESTKDAIDTLANLVDTYVLDNTEAVSTTLLTSTLETWLLSGCIVSTYDFGEYNYSDSNYNTITLTIQPDNCILLDDSGNVMLQSSASAGFDMGGFLSGMLSSLNQGIGSALGLSGSVTDVVGSAISTGLSSAVSTVESWF